MECVTAYFSPMKQYVGYCFKCAWAELKMSAITRVVFLTDRNNCVTRSPCLLNLIQISGYNLNRNEFACLLLLSQSWELAHLQQRDCALYTCKSPFLKLCNSCEADKVISVCAVFLLLCCFSYGAHSVVSLLWGNISFSKAICQVSKCDYSACKFDA